MAANMFGVEDLVASEASVASAITAEARGAYDRYPLLLDTLLKLPNFAGPLADSATEAGLFAFFAHSHYLQAPHTIRAVFILAERGYYLEATMLLRSLSEVLVQLRYFNSRHSELVAHLDPTQRGARFIDMFEAVSPGYYRKYYGDLHSAFVHGKLGPLYFRYENGGKPERRIRLGCEYVRDSVGFVFNQLNALVAGFLNLFPTFFPANTIAADVEFETQYASATASIAEGVAAHRAGFPESENWHQVMERLIRV